MLPKALTIFTMGMFFPFFMSASNLIENHSFEIDDGKGVRSKWKANKAEKTNGVEHKRETGDATDGKYAAVIKNVSPQNGVSQFMAWIQNLNPAQLDPYIPGKEMLLTFDYSTDAPATAIRAYVEGRSPGGRGFSAMGPTATRYVGWGRYSLRFRLPQEKPNLIYVVLQLLNTGTVKFDNVRLDTAPPEQMVPEAATAKQPRDKLKLNVSYGNFPPRNTCYLPELPRKLNVHAHMGKEKFSELFIALKSDDGKLIRQWRLESRGNRIDGVIDIPRLEAGLYHLQSTAFSLGNRITDSETFRIMDKTEPSGVRFRKDHIMLLNGEPFFPLAVCPPYITNEALAAYRDAGFNTITPQVNASGSRKLTDFLYPHAAKYGLNVIEWVNFADNANQPVEELRQRVKDAVRHTAGIRNFIGWMNDEDAWRGIPAENVKKVYDIFYRYAPNHILWCNQAPRGSIELLTEYGRYCDVTGADVYPIPASVKHSEMPNKTIACIGNYTDDFLESVHDRKPVWMILQAWSWGGKKGTPDKPLPTYRELRFMFYNAITHGATGIAWFDNNTMDPSSPVFRDLAAVNLEFKEIESFLTRGIREDFAAIESNQPGIRLMSRSCDDGKMMIVVNELDKPQKVSIKTTGGNWYPSPGNRSSVTGSDTLTLDMKPLDVMLLVSRPLKFRVPEQFPKLKISEPVPLAESVKSGNLNQVKWRGNWVWNSELTENKGYSKTTAQQNFMVNGKINSAWLAVAADNIYELEINGKHIGGSPVFKLAVSYDIAPYLKQGRNTITIKITNLGSYGGVVFEGEVNDAKGTQAILSGKDTLFQSASGAFNIRPCLFGPPPVKPWGNIMAVPLN